MLAELWGIEWLFWWQIPLVGTFVVVVFGGGALLWVGGKYVAKAPKATFWRSVGTNLLVALVLSFCSLFGLALGWLIIKGMFGTTYGKAVLAWLPTIPTSLVGIGLLAALLAPTFQQPNELVNRTVCMSNLSSIGKAIVLYRAVNEDRFPPDFDALIAAGHSAKLFVCPSADPSQRPAGWRYDFFYLPATSDRDPNQILACDFRANHRGKQRNVLYVSMDVDRMTEAQFQTALDDPINAEFAKALRAMEGP